jgi:hypothetical protein
MDSKIFAMTRGGFNHAEVFKMVDTYISFQIE